MAHPGPALAAETNNFLIPNFTFVVELVLFLLIFFVLARLVLPRIQSALRGRQEMVDRQIEDSEKARTQLVQAESAYQSALRDARSEAAQIREDARVEAQQIVEAARASAQAESARIIARGEDQLAGQRAAIVSDLRAEVGTLAVELSGKIVDQPLAGQPDVTATVESFLAGLTADEHARNEAGA